MADDATLRRVLDRVEQVTGKAPKKSGQWWSGLCPAHGDKSASLGIRHGEKGLKVKCFAGCEFSAIVRALGMEEKEFFYPTPGRPPRSSWRQAAQTPSGRAQRPRKRKDRGTPVIVQKELSDYVWAYEVKFPDGATHLVKRHAERGVHCNCTAWRFRSPCSHVRAVGDLRGEPVPARERKPGQAGESRGGAAGVGADTSEGAEPPAAAADGLADGGGAEGGETSCTGPQEAPPPAGSPPRAPVDREAGKSNAAPVGRLTVEELALAKGLDPAHLTEWGVVERKRVVHIPYRLADGRLWPRVHVRFTLEKGPDRFRWWPNREAGWELGEDEARIIPYGLWLLENVRHCGGALVIVEGETDCWALWSHGIAALGLPSASVASTLQAAHLAEVSEIFLVREPDRGGDTLTPALGERLVELEWAGMARVMTCGDYADVADLLTASRQAGGAGFEFEEAFRERQAAATPLPRPPPRSDPVYLKPAYIAVRFLAEAPPPGGVLLWGEEPGWRMIYHRDRWYRWNGRCYDEVKLPALVAYMARFIESAWWTETKRKETYDVHGHATNAGIGNALKSLAGRCVRDDKLEPPAWLDGRRANYLVVLENGVLDVLDVRDMVQGSPQALRPHDPELFAVNALPYAYEPEARCPAWQAYLDRVLPDKALQALLGEWAGYCLIPTNTYKWILLLQGESDSGKSVYTAVLRRLIGIENCSAISLEELDESHALADMVGKLLNLAGEWTKLSPKANAILKRISGNDPVRVNPKNQSGETWVLPARFVLTTNDPPMISDRSSATWNRLACVPFDVVIPKREQKHFERYVDELCTELPGIFLWALQGLARLMKRGQWEDTERTLEIKAEYRLESAPEARFCEEMLQTTYPGDYIFAHEAYSAYETFCDELGVRHPGTMKRLGQAVQRWHKGQTSQDLVVMKKGAARRRAYIGVCRVGDGGGEL